MSKLITPEISSQLKEHFSGLKNPVKLIYFTQQNECGACADQKELLEALAEYSGKISLEVHRLDTKIAVKYGIDKVPATVITGKDDPGIRFYGLTGGYEFGSLVEAISLVSAGKDGVDPSIRSIAEVITKPVHIEVMVSLSCPYCPKMVHIAHQLAMASDKAQGDMVDVSEFPQLISRYDVHGVPLTIVNGKRGFEGALEPDQAILNIIKISDPEIYEILETQIREAEGVKKTKEVSKNELYDVIVVGAGPSGLSAALYSQRKGRITALIGKEAGGQINDTAVIENYPGVASIGGPELAQAMRQHVEIYPVSERCHTQVDSIMVKKNIFHVHTEDKQIYKSRSVIFCAGKRYKRLNVAGEERFIGRGIAWCATCDAPLYTGKRVAVIGGGNSAFTAARDLLRYASQITMIHVLDGFQADKVLVEEIIQAKKSGKVKIYLKSQVREFLGKDKLEGVRIASDEGQAVTDVAVDGVFLEIGLEPNSAAVTNLITLNENGEVPVNKDQSTEIPGFFSAGDVTDEPDKQIVIAAGAGAKAALSADRYLNSFQKQVI
ncbi:MAG: FAD-dependent oxidoreductase [Spirochaetes bacterium]|nr:FAD-dependent oxidoreductase [Spirochaetota bacterium]